MAGYKISNDPSATDDTVAFPGLAKHFTIDSILMTAAFNGTFWGAGSVQNADPSFWAGTTNSVAFTPGTTSTLTMTTGSNYFNSTSGYVYITAANGSTWAKVEFTTYTAGVLSGLTCTGPGVGIAFAIGSTISAPILMGAPGYFQIQGTPYQTNIALGKVYYATAPDTTYDRIDLVYLDNTGNYGILPGTPSPNPVPPSLLLDGLGNSFVLLIGLMYIPANATTFTSGRNFRSLIIRRNDMLGLTTVANAALSVMTLVTRYVLYTSLSATRVVTLPRASLVPAGHTVTVADGSGSCTPAVLITVKASAAGSGTDTVNGITNANGGYSLSGPYQSATFMCDGSGAWVVVNATDRGGTLSGTVSSTVQSSTSATVDLVTHNLPANTLQVTGDSFKARTVISFAANSNSKVVTIKFGGTNLFTYTTTFATAHAIEVDVEIMRNGSTSGRAFLRAASGGTGTFSVTQPNHVSVSSKDWSTSLDYVITSSIQTVATDVQALASKATWSQA